MAAAARPAMPARPQGQASKFWQFRNLSDDEAELLLYGEIAESTWWGDEVTPKQFLSDLKALGNKKTITVRINSPGGDVFAAEAISNNLRDNSAYIIAKGDGIVASAAVRIFESADKRIMASSSYLMIHKPAAGLLGYFMDDELEQVIKELGVIKEGIVNGYAERTKKDRKAISKLMDAVTWMTGEEAIAEGFADELMSQSSNTQNSVVDGSRLIVNGVGFDMAMLPQRVVASLAARSANPGLTPGSNIPTNTIEEVINSMEIKDITTVDALKKTFPALTDQLTQAANTAGVEAERKRIQAIDGLADKVDPALIKNAKYIDATQTAEGVAMTALKEGKFLNTAYVAAAAADANASGANGVTGATPDMANGKVGEDKAAVAHVSNVAKDALAHYTPAH